MNKFTLLLLVAVLCVAGCGKTKPGDSNSNVPTPEANAEAAKFEGTWVVIAAKIDDDDLPNQVGIEYTFAKGKLTQREGDRTLDTAKLSYFPTTKPKGLDIVSDHLREGESPALFIYEFVGEQLRLCRGDKERPTAFTGKDQVVLTLKRK